jgi:UDP-2,3-diacylglucosamine pyrophosphatase LpxH
VTIAERERTQAKHLFVFQHQPWFLEEPDEEDQYFNIPKERRTPMLEEMAKADVRAVFAGHYHRNSYGTMGTMEMITTSAVGRPLGADPSGFRVRHCCVK